MRTSPTAEISSVLLMLPVSEASAINSQQWHAMERGHGGFGERSTDIREAELRAGTSETAVEWIRRSAFEQAGEIADD